MKLKLKNSMSYLYILITLSLYSCALHPCLASQNSQFLDSHLHIFFENVEKIDQEVKQNINEIKKLMKHSYSFNKYFVISPSYLVDQRYAKIGDDETYEMSNLNLRNLYDDKTKDIIKAFPGTLYGLCGVNYSWSDFVSYSSQCLKQKEYIGVKLRFSDLANNQPDRLTNSNYVKRVTSLLTQQSNSKLKVMLIHMPGNYPSYHFQVNVFPVSKQEVDAEFTLSKKEINQVIKWAKSYPNTQFLLAHSMNSYHLVEYLNQKKGNLKNIWLDISTSLELAYVMNSENSANGQGHAQAFAKSWQTFGMDRILYGSDQYIGSNTSLLIVRNRNDFSSAKNEFNYLKRLRFLSEEEKQMILSKNPKKLFQILKL